MPPNFSQRSRTHVAVLAIALGLFALPVEGLATASTPVPRPGHHLPPAALAALKASRGPQVSFDYPRAELPARPDVASLAIPGRNGVYLVPYIQTQPDLHFRVRVQQLPPGATVVVTMDPGQPDEQTADVGPPTYDGTFGGVPMGEHALVAQVRAGPQRVHVRGNDGSGDVLAVAHLGHVARGDIVAALGDSTTEGNGGPVFGFLPNWVSALSNAAEWTSPDGRNFPQAGALSRPQAPASFTSTLGTVLEQQRGHPVLVLNDGWSGATADAYSHIADSGELAAEYAAAKPNAWLVNLGVNDPLTHQAPLDFAGSINHITASLTGRFGAQPGDIYLACPTYAKDGRHDGEATYLPVINQLRANSRLSAGPDFFNFYKAHPDAVADEVHPNAAGYRDMAILWAQALGGRGAPCG